MFFWNMMSEMHLTIEIYPSFVSVTFLSLTIRLFTILLTYSGSALVYSGPIIIVVGYI